MTGYSRLCIAMRLSEKKLIESAIKQMQGEEPSGTDKKKKKKKKKKANNNNNETATTEEPKEQK